MMSLLFLLFRPSRLSTAQLRYKMVVWELGYLVESAVYGVWSLVLAVVFALQLIWCHQVLPSPLAALSVCDCLNTRSRSRAQP
jgi:hypothetical protein